MTTETYLYRHFDGYGRLLYVGISSNAIARLAGHKASSVWFPQIRRVEIEPYPDRAAALAAERTAIDMEKPIYNDGKSSDGATIPIPQPDKEFRIGCYAIPNGCMSHRLIDKVFKAPNEDIAREMMKQHLDRRGIKDYGELKVMKPYKPKKPRSETAIKSNDPNIFLAPNPVMSYKPDIA